MISEALNCLIDLSPFRSNSSPIEGPLSSALILSPLRSQVRSFRGGSGYCLLLVYEALMTSSKQLNRYPNSCRPPSPHPSNPHSFRCTQPIRYPQTPAQPGPNIVKQPHNPTPRPNLDPSLSPIRLSWDQTKQAGQGSTVCPSTVIG